VKPGVGAPVTSGVPIAVVLHLRHVSFRYLMPTVRFAAIAAFTLVFCTSLRAAVEIYKIDSAHSSVGFNVRHFFTKVPGVFAKTSGTIRVDRENLERSSVEASIDVGSVNTREQKRDAHLKNADFFLVEKFPTMTFKSTSWKKTGDDTYDVTGDLTIKDQTKPVVLKVKSLGFGPGSRGAQLSGWEATTKLDRRDFGITYGQGVVGNDVDVTIDIEAVLQK
jgi:polyisoprenoid-binding protein YceI